MPTTQSPELSLPEQQMIDLIGDQLEYHRFARTAGRLLGFAIVTGDAFTSQQAEEALGMSAGSVSGGLKPLLDVGLLRRVDVRSDRRYHYIHDETALDRVLDASIGAMERHRAQIKQRLRPLTRPGAAERIERLCRMSEIIGETMKEAAQRLRSEPDAQG